MKLRIEDDLKVKKKYKSLLLMYTYNVISGVSSILIVKHFLKIISVFCVNGMNEII